MTNNTILEHRFNELYERAELRRTREFTDFLNLNEISILKTALPEGCYTLYGGYEGAERCVAGFGEISDNSDFPISCVLIEPAGIRFAENLSHRDYLGSVLALGITRETLGDIITDGKSAYIFCRKNISDYITDNLSSVRHTTVKCSAVNNVPEILTQPPEAREIIVPSLRTDAVISAIYKLSRKSTAALFAQDKVFINAVQCTKSSKTLSENDIVSVRGYGRFIYCGEERKTKKDRAVITVRVY